MHLHSTSWASCMTDKSQRYSGCSMQAETLLQLRLVEVSSYLHSDTITAHSGFASPPSRPFIAAGQATCPLHGKVASSGWLGCFMQAETMLQSRLQEVSSYLHSDTITAHSGFASPPSRPFIAAGLATCPLHGNVASSGWQFSRYNHGSEILRHLDLGRLFHSVSGCVSSLLQHGFFVSAEGASSRDDKNPHVLLLHVSRHQLVHSSLRSSYRSHNWFFPLPPSLYVYRQPSFTLDRATLMYATGRPSNLHFLSAREVFLYLKTGASAASNVAQRCCAHQTIYIFRTASHLHVTIVHR